MLRFFQELLCAGFLELGVMYHYHDGEANK